MASNVSWSLARSVYWPLLADVRVRQKFIIWLQPCKRMEEAILRRAKRLRWHKVEMMLMPGWLCFLLVLQRHSWILRAKRIL